MDLTETEIKRLLKHLGYHAVGSYEELDSTLFDVLFEPISNFAKISEIDEEYIERFAYSLSAEELIDVCNGDSLLSLICDSREFWINKIKRDFKADIEVLEDYTIDQLKDLYIESSLNNRILSVYLFLQKTIKVRRAGIIPMIKRGNYTFYGLGLDYGSGDINEFAGGRESRDNDMLETALREFNEETFDIFDVTREDIITQNNDVLFDYYSCIFFVEIENKNMLGLVDKFNNKVEELIRKGEKVENGYLFWVTEAQLKALLAIKRSISNFKYSVFFYYTIKILLTFKF